jgi:hypothetical protein
MPSSDVVPPVSPACPDSVKRLVDRFATQSDIVTRTDYNETQLRIDYINPLFDALGWDMSNAQGYAEQYREVVHEDRVRVAGQTKAPDYSFRVGGQRKYFLEAKKPAVDIRNNWEPAYQLRRYAWSAKLAVSILTDFEELAVYDARIPPKQLEKPSVGRREYLIYTDFVARWDFLSGTFSKYAVLRGDFDRYCESKKGRGAQAFDDAFLEEIEGWRKLLASNLALRNESLSEGGLNFAVQRIVDRIIFLRIAEDRGTETVGQLQGLLNGENTYDRLQVIFRAADARYNSGLFHFARERDRDEAPDTLTPGLEIDDKTLKDILAALYYPRSPYEFTMVSADILGSVYERFLGKVITLTAGHRAKIEDKPEVRKAGGVYYTPVYIVDYIVKNTVGKLLEGKTPKEAAKLKVLDPACGSGSFLIGAYQFLLDWYLKQYLSSDPAALAAAKNPVVRPNAAGGFSLTIAERKRILLDHIHGVDLDGQAVEVTKLNLLLKCLEGETSQTLGFESRLFRERALPDLGKNILCGNSLIGTDIMITDAWKEMSDEEKAKVNPFDYARAFPGVFKGKEGGFDAVIGNPPYIRIHNLVDNSPVEVALYQQQYSSAAFGKVDIYVVFMERGLSLLRPSGVLGFITPNKFLQADYGVGIRRIISEQQCLSLLVDFGSAQIFDGATTYTSLVFLTNGKCDRFGFEELNKDASPKDFLARLAPEACDAASLTPETWTLGRKDSLQAIAKIEIAGRPLTDFLDLLITGVKTGNNAVFSLDVEHESGGMIKATCEDSGEEVEIEREVTRPYAKAESLKRYQITAKGRSLLYPYAIEEGRTRLIAAEVFKQKHPRAWSHLLRHKTALEGRQKGKLRGPNWYGLSFASAIEMFDAAKLVTPTLSPTNAFSYDESRLTFPQGAGGGCGLVPKSGVSHLYLLGCLNSRLLTFYFQRISSRFQGGWFAYEPRYLKRIPIVDPTAKEKQAKEIAALADSMLSLHKRLAAETLPQRREQLEREIDATDRQIDALVYQLYGLTDDEIRIVEEATR